GPVKIFGQGTKLIVT
uniref:Uncharacterized protein n=1 Tax=Sarcophilus harrisii TaxID=9305 RepID=A0A7N4PBQ4_SARHA